MAASILSAHAIAVRAAERARGNDRATAQAIGQALLAQSLPAQLTLVRCERIANHRVCGLILSGVKFKFPVHRSGFLSEVRTLINVTFATAPVDEVDVWATVPLSAGHGSVVSGDSVKAGAATVFAVTIRRQDLAHLSARLAGSDDVYWDSVFANALAKGTAQ